MRNQKFIVAASLAALGLGGVAKASYTAGIFITEFNSNSGNGDKFEFTEITNTTTAAKSISGWSIDDSSYTSNKKPLNAIFQYTTATGTKTTPTAVTSLAPGQSVIYTEADPAAFISYWGSKLPATVLIQGPYSSDSLSSTGDSISLFDNHLALVDAIDYNATNGDKPGTTNPTLSGTDGSNGNASGVSRDVPSSAFGISGNTAVSSFNNGSITNDENFSDGVAGVTGTYASSAKNAHLVDSAVGDTYGSYVAAQNSLLVGNPGVYAVPEPTMMALLGLGGLFAARRRRA